MLEPLPHQERSPEIGLAEFPYPVGNHRVEGSEDPTVLGFDQPIPPGSENAVQNAAARDAAEAGDLGQNTTLIEPAEGTEVQERGTEAPARETQGDHGSVLLHRPWSANAY